ncbi:MAG TPA: hypothetical protein VKA70_01215 [Blastocatellia bacterium]|nr:hypothetical protein [Blastocatellia bacterium]
MKNFIRLAFASVLVVSLAHIPYSPRSTSAFAIGPAARAATAFQQTPKIIGARVDKKKLIVTGADFSPGAAIFINGVKQKTKNDGASPTTTLIVKKGGKKIVDGEVTSLRVENAGGVRSNEFGFFDGPSVTLEDGDKTLTLHVGDRFLLFLKSPTVIWSVTQLDPAIVKKAANAELIQGAQGVFEAAARGQTELVAVGELPCHNANPPCMAPTLGFVLKIVVE